MTARKNQEIVNFHGIITGSPRMKKVFELIQRVARTGSAVLVRGQTGTGKELVARAIHNLSPRRQHTYSALNCAALTPELMQSELFGHVKGAFTGAVANHRGLFEVSDGGSIFLDEIAEMPLEIQSRLLRVLQERTFTKVGATKVQSVDVRFISATHKALRSQVEAGLFREDLMYRIRVVPVFLPPLRERDDDVEILARHFVEEFNQLGYRHVERIDPSVCDALRGYGWPGNIRELRNNIEYAFNIGEGPVLRLDELTPELRGIEPDRSMTGEPSFADEERRQMLDALRQSRGNKGEAAALIGMSRSTFWRKAREYQI